MLTYKYDNNDRIKQLATPKSSKRSWLTSYDSRVLWGNQESIRPMSRSATRHQASDRTIRLSTPKRDHKTEHWANVDFLNYQARSERAVSAPSKTRIIQMSTPKPLHPKFVPNKDINDLGQVNENGGPECPRSSPRPRTSRLAMSRRHHKMWTNNSQMRPVSSSAMKHEVSQRTNQISRHLERKSYSFRDTNHFQSSPPEMSITKVSVSARRHKPSARTLKLSESKKYHDGYRGNRSPLWEIPGNVKNTNASKRTVELSVPFVRKEKDEFNPEAFIVKPLALKAVCSDRISKLAEPTKRK